ncbi:sulfatase-like hydrolase/transferase [Verrucomicrobiaceae bacterium 5K15]|uniref:Sulfatase-like hydrolase/transferase n=1 Tax=Oceaniferula flava TaxID=2800421 RepID=A0AAE2VDM1_9BACT|nr:sulfatase-like hydrolase/transferase [Oceaniferula flavus]MBK1854774.1 sulfatase-like hydrolase/transferase [Oceaniferula flavus]MBM1136080.1 sulfatase-like hydrolase/transferase [Oceaniferula flavus]
MLPRLRASLYRQAQSLMLTFALVAVTFPASATCAPVAYWSLDGSTVSERLTESLGHSAINATEHGGSSTWNTRSGFGELLANGSGIEYLSIPHQSILDPGTGDFSISLWAYRTSNANSAKGLVDFLSASAGSGYQLFYQADNSIRIRLDDTGGNTINVDTSGTHYDQNTWQNIIVTVDRTNKLTRIYVNGAEATPSGGIDISVLTESIIPDQDLWLGSLNGYTAARGRLDDFGIFNHVLSPSEIATIQAGGGTPLSEVFPVETVAAVTLSPASGVIRPGDTIAITPDEAVDNIYYTLDGSDPDTGSTLYSGPITLPSGGELRAVAYKNNAAGAIASGHYSVVPASPPNIVLIVADDLGFGDLSCYGAPTVHTPNLDQLAVSGTRFTQFTTCGPGDLANQYALLTGRVARRADLPASLDSGNTDGLDSREWTLAESLRRANYQTAIIGEWHLGDTAGSTPSDQGFQIFYGLPYHATAIPTPPLQENETEIDSPYHTNTLLNQLTQRAITFIATQGPDPFFLVFQPPSIPATGTSLLGSHGDQVEAMDASVGEIRSALASAGKTANTLVIFISAGTPDLSASSAPLGSTGLFTDGGSTTWEGGVRTPAIASWPGVIPAATDNYAVLWLPDLFSSITQIADSYTPDDRPYDGTARAEVLLAGRQQPDGATSLFLHRHNGTDYQLQAVRKGPWKYHLAYNNSDPQNTTSLTAPLLYHLEYDPTEHIDRSSSHTSEMTELQEIAASYQTSFASPNLQLPPAKPPFLDEPETAVDASTGTFSGKLTRPMESLNDHYQIEYSYDLVSWTQLAIDDYITSVTPLEGNAETVNFSVDLNNEVFTPSPVFFRLRASRP